MHSAGGGGGECGWTVSVCRPWQGTAQVRTGAHTHRTARGCTGHDSLKSKQF